jgi:hypothetical protein
MHTHIHTPRQIYVYSKIAMVSCNIVAQKCTDRALHGMIAGNRILNLLVIGSANNSLSVVSCRQNDNLEQLLKIYGPVMYYFIIRSYE